MITEIGGELGNIAEEEKRQALNDMKELEVQMYTKQHKPDDTEKHPIGFLRNIVCIFLG